MVDMAVIFGADKEIAKKDYLDVLELETTIANVSKTVIFVRNSNIFANFSSLKQIL